MADSSEDESMDDGNRYDDAEDDVEIDFRSPAVTGVSNFEDADEDDAVDVEAVAVVPVVPSRGIRGKPEAMAAALAASNIPEVKEQLEAEKQQQHFGIGIAEAPAVVVAEPVRGGMSSMFGSVDAQATPVPDNDVKPPPKKKQKKQSTKQPKTKQPKQTKQSKQPKETGKSPSSANKKAPKSTSTPIELNAPSLDDPIDPITDAEYQNIVHLMDHFCRVPLLAEFSRPVTLLHPELMAAYSKIVSHPIDLGRVCRKIGRRQYRNTREVQLDMWRIFANCVKYHSHPSNKEGVPSFVSIALHLREFWNALFQEFMLPSDPPKKALTVKGGSASTRYLRETYATREEDRKKRLIVSGLTCMSLSCMRRSAEKIRIFLANRGCVDQLDVEPLFPLPGDSWARGMDEDDLNDLQLVVEKLSAFAVRLTELVAESAEYTVEQFDKDLKACYLSDVFENNSALKFRVRNRFNRFLGKILVPINEANCRGVTQSSIWGCMAAAIWARESQKKPYWPALVLGILAPDDQKEDWHWALTDRNEQRLPEALRTQLSAGKRKAQVALKRQSQGQADPQSFFLVEFLGTHEFIWVRETDIVESFEPEDDPNVKMQASKKKRGGRISNASIVGSKKYQSAIEEAGWALEEFEQQLQDACGDIGGDDEDEQDGNYSYSVLCVSDDEADDVYDDNDDMSLSQIEEANELIATRGLLDFSATGRKNAKKRAQMLKKQKYEAEKKHKLLELEKAKKQKAAKKKKVSTVAKSKEKEEKKEQRELDRRRKKRTRERERSLKSSARKTHNKRRRISAEDMEQESTKDLKNLTLNKRARATAIVKSYLTRMAKDEEYRSLGLQGIMSIPAAMVDSSGLLGMALAFRAAAGQLAMPDESGDHAQVKLWDAIAVKDTMSPEQRVEALRKQAELLETEIRRVRSATAARIRLAEHAEMVRAQLDKEIFKEEALARENPFKKKKKAVSSGSKGTDDSPAGKSDQGKDDDEEDMKEADGEGDIEEFVGLGPTHVTETPMKESADGVDSEYE